MLSEKTVNTDVLSAVGYFICDRTFHNFSISFRRAKRGGNFICRVFACLFCIASVQSYIITKTDKTGQ